MANPAAGRRLARTVDKILWQMRHHPRSSAREAYIAMAGPAQDATTLRSGGLARPGGRARAAGSASDECDKGETVSGHAAAMRYRDVAAASDWLCAAFGFQKHLIVTGDSGAVHYAQLTFGEAMFMLAPVRDAAIDTYMRQPDEIGGAETQSCYLVVGDADAHYARAKASGAEIILDIADDDFGARGYSCRDPEGHIWNFGTHDPWRGKGAGGRPARARTGASGAMRPWLAALGLLIAIAAASATTAGMYGAFRQPETLSLVTAHDTTETVAKEAEERAARAVLAAQERVNVEQSAREAAERGALEAREQLVRERTAKVTAERALEQASKRQAEAATAKEAAEGALENARRERDALRGAKPDAEPERIAVELRQELDRERAGREIAERNAEQAQHRAREERSNREAAERAASDMRAQLDSGQAVRATAEHSIEQLRQQLSQQQTAREVAERTAKEARDQLNREQSAKNAAWKTAAQLRRQLSQVQSASEPAADVAAEPEAESPAPVKKARPKQKQKAKTTVEE